MTYLDQIRTEASSRTIAKTMAFLETNYGWPKPPGPPSRANLERQIKLGMSAKKKVGAKRHSSKKKLRTNPR